MRLGWAVAKDISSEPVRSDNSRAGGPLDIGQAGTFCRMEAGREGGSLKKVFTALIYIPSPKLFKIILLLLPENQNKSREVKGSAN